MLSRQIHNPVMYLHLLLKFHCTDNKHELIQVVVAANVTTQKTIKDINAKMTRLNSLKQQDKDFFKVFINRLRVHFSFKNGFALIFGQTFVLFI